MTSAFQAAAQQQGHMYDQQCRYLLQDAGWDCSPTPIYIRTAGIEIDCAATKHNTTIWIEFKGSWRGNQPGMRRTDTTKKALLTGFLLAATGHPHPYIVLTSHLPQPGSAGATMVDIALRTGTTSAVLCTSDPGWAAQLDRITHERTPV